jgi:hypothetical protein
VPGPLFTVVHDQLLCLADVEGEVVVLAPHCLVTDLLPIGCLIVIRSSTVEQTYHRCEGTRHATSGAPMLRVSVADVMLPNLTTWVRPVRKSRGEGGVQSQGPELSDELGGDYGV